MKLLIPIILAFFVINLHAAPIQEIAKSGKVSLLQVSRLDGANKNGAPDGIMAVFLVTPNSAQKRKFTLTETRDFTLNGKSYAATTQTYLKKTFEPDTTIYDVDEYFRDHPEVARVVEAPPSKNGCENVLLTIAIYGMKMPAAGKVQMLVKVGYNLTVEPYAFSFELPPPEK